MTDTDLLNRITVLEDMERIKRLKRKYCYFADDGIAGNADSWDAFMSHWADECWADFGPFGVHQGKKAVADFYKTVVPDFLSYSAHMVTNPIIEVIGSTATGKWYVDVPCTIRATNQAAWLQAKYDEEYVKIDGEWKWKSITATFDFISPFDSGWAITPMVQAG